MSQEKNKNEINKLTDLPADGSVRIVMFIENDHDINIHNSDLYRNCQNAQLLQILIIIF